MVIMVLPWDALNNFKDVIIETLLPEVKNINTKLDNIHTRLDTFEQKLDQIRSDVNIEGRVHDIEDKTSHLDHQQRDILRKIKPRTVAV